MSQKYPPAPEKLRPEAKRLWQRVVRDFEVTPDRLEILRTAVFSLHDFLNYREQMEAEGAVFAAKGGMIRKNPLSEVVKSSRMGFLSAMKSLGVDYTDEPRKGPGRPAQGIGVS
jgi:P27 family predicted phage terminase small subunit